MATAHHLQATGKNPSGVVARPAVTFLPQENNEQGCFFAAEPSSTVPGGEVRIQVPLSEPGNAHSILNDVAIQFQVFGGDSDATDIIVRNGAALIRDLRISVDNVEIVRVDDSLELDLLFRESLRQWYDPAACPLKVAGWVPPGVDAATGSLTQAGFETVPDALEPTYAFKRSSVGGITNSPYRHTFQLSLATAFGSLFRKWDPRRCKEMQIRIQFLANGSLAEVNRAIAFSANTTTYATCSLGGIGVRLYRSTYFVRVPSLHLSTREPVSFIQRRYDFSTLPAGLDVAGQLEYVVNLNNHFPARDHCTRLLWAFAPPPPGDSATVNFSFERSVAAVHEPCYFDVSFQGTKVMSVTTGFELERHRSNWYMKRHKNSDEPAGHPNAVADAFNLPFVDFLSGYREQDPGTDLMAGISVGSSGSSQQYVVTLRTPLHRPAIVGAQPLHLWLILESLYCVHVGAGSNSGGPLPVVRQVGL